MRANAQTEAAVMSILNKFVASYRGRIFLYPLPANKRAIRCRCKGGAGSGSMLAVGVQSAV